MNIFNWLSVEKLVITYIICVVGIAFCRSRSDLRLERGTNSCDVALSELAVYEFYCVD